MASRISTREALDRLVDDFANKQYLHGTNQGGEENPSDETRLHNNAMRARRRLDKALDLLCASLPETSSRPTPSDPDTENQT